MNLNNDLESTVNHFRTLIFPIIMSIGDPSAPGNADRIMFLVLKLYHIYISATGESTDFSLENRKMKYIHQSC